MNCAICDLVNVIRFLVNLNFGVLPVVANCSITVDGMADIYFFSLFPFIHSLSWILPIRLRGGDNILEFANE